MNKFMALGSLLFLAGCGNTELFPYDPTTNTFLDKPQDASSSFAVFVTDKTGWGGNYPIQRAIVWDNQRKAGLEKKQIYVSIYPKTNTILGDAVVGGSTYNLYLLSTDAVVDVIATVLHEDEHLRGLTHEQMLDYAGYVQLAQSFLGNQKVLKH